MLRYQRGLFLKEGGGTCAFTRAAKDQEAEMLFLSLLEEFTQQGQFVSDKNGRSFAPPTFAEHPRARKARVGNLAFKDAMARLFASGKIRVDVSGPASRQTTKLVRS